MRVLTIALLGAAVVAALQPARAAGCQVLATGHPSIPNSCRYVATGPGEFEVATISGFRIQILDPEPRRGTLVAQTAEPDMPITGIAVTAGSVETRPGDVVEISIGIAQVDPGQDMDPFRYQDGVIRARDA